MRRDLVLGLPMAMTARRMAGMVSGGLVRGLFLVLLVVPAFPSAEDRPGGGPPASVVRVRSRPGCLEDLVGSGVVIAPGVVVTNAHVVHGSEDIKVLKDGKAYGVQSHVLAPEYDLCLLRVPGLEVPEAAISEEIPMPGHPLEAWGFPGGTAGNNPVQSPGTLTAAWRYRGSVLLQVDAEIRKGQSGGGLFLPDGRLVGITTFSLLGAGRAHFAVPAAWIEELRRRPWIPGQLIPVCKPRSVLLHELLDRLTEDPENRPPWEAFARAWVHAEPRQAEAWYALGHVLLVRYHDLAQYGTLDSALLGTFVDAFRKAVALDPAHARAWNNLGVAYLAQGRLSSSREALEMAVQLNPDYGLAWINLSATLLELREYARAARALQEGLRLVPDEAAAWARLGFCNLKLGRLAPAESALRIALRYRPSHRSWILDLAEVLLLRSDAAALETLRNELRARDPEGARELALREKAWKQRGPLSFSE